MNDLASTLGIENLKVVDAKLDRIYKIAKKYETELKNIYGVELMKYDSDRRSSYWLFPLLVDNRENFILKMREAKIPVTVVHQGIDKNSLFGGYDKSLVNQRLFDEKQIHIPIHEALTDEQVDYIINTIKNV